ncbi:MAG TPA: hypothetical protein DCQ04_07920 [Actinobacteria bacterium]|nr:hypothetical protein [Actinomycetota bacterium]
MRNASKGRVVGRKLWTKYTPRGQIALADYPTIVVCQMEFCPNDTGKETTLRHTVMSLASCIAFPTVEVTKAGLAVSGSVVGVGGSGVSVGG